MNYTCELANIEDLDTILNLYSERTQWFKENEIIAGFELSTNSKDWKDDITPAYYIYIQSSDKGWL